MPLAVCVLAALGAQGCYLTEQARGQATVLLGRRPVGAVLWDPAVPEADRGRLTDLLRARDFGVERLGLAGRSLYRTYYDTGGQPIAWNVSASPKDRFESVTWWFPIVGSVPYLGFFDEASAQARAEALRGRDLDVLLRPVGAYSTLGWFDDPVFSSALYPDRFATTRTVLHEMAHATVFFAGEVEFNENFATLVGDRGALLLLAAQHGAGSAAVREAEARMAEEAGVEAHMLAVVRRLEALYADGALSSADKVARRGPVLAEGKEALARRVAASELGAGRTWLNREWNNASLLSFTRYHGDQAALVGLLDGRFGGDLRAFVEWVGTLSEPPGP